MSTKILVTGAAGMLAGDLVPALRLAGHELVLADLHSRGDSCQLDITDASAVREVVRRIEPDYVVNCAAYTAVDRAEAEQEAAFGVNCQGASNLAQALREFGGTLVHISTDYVFGAATPSGVKGRPFTEDDQVAPCGIYGKSKQAGEREVSTILPERHLIVRTSWLHGVHGPNFVHTILKVAREREELRVVDDQFGSPTWTGWLAGVLCELIERKQIGVFHASSRGDISWFDFAREIVLAAGLPTKVLPQSTAQAARPAPRPAYSTLGVTKLERVLGRPCPDWQVTLRSHIALLENL